MSEEVVIETPLAKSHVILVDPPAGTSTQPAGDDDMTLPTPDGAIEPPESLEQIAAWSKLNGTRSAIIDAIARNTVGLGYHLEVDEGHEREVGDPRSQIAEAAARLEACAARDRRLEKPSLTELMYAVKTDEEEVGNGYLEVSRSRFDGRVDGLYHLPGKRVRRLATRRGYLLLPPDGDPANATYFTEFGEKVTYGRDGKPTNRLADGHTGGWRRNEVIAFRLYTSESRDYGLPRDMALALEYLGEKAAMEANAGYFAQGGALPTVLFVQGEERRDGATISVKVPHEVTERIHSVLTAGSSPGQNRVAVVPLPAGVKAQREVLGQISDKDIGYVDFRDDIRQRTLSAFRVSPVFIGLTQDSRYGAEVERAITKEQVFDPEQDRYERRLTELVLRDLGYPELRLVFRDLAVEDDAAKRSSAEKMAEVGAITWREYRAAHGYAPLPEGGDTGWPEGFNDQLMPAAGRPDGAENRVVAGDGQQGLTPGLAGRDSRDRGQAESDVERTVRRLARRNGQAGRAGARRALERARRLPTDG